jgi:transcriptional regulator with XRE-family HTH domain
MDKCKKIGQRIKRIREISGLTSTYVINKLLENGYDININEYLKYENESAGNMSIPLFVDIAVILNVDPAYLMGWIDENGEEIKK